MNQIKKTFLFSFLVFIVNTHTMQQTGSLAADLAHMSTTIKNGTETLLVVGGAIALGVGTKKLINFWNSSNLEQTRKKIDTIGEATSDIKITSNQIKETGDQTLAKVLEAKGILNIMDPEIRETWSITKIIDDRTEKIEQNINKTNLTLDQIVEQLSGLKFNPEEQTVAINNHTTEESNRIITNITNTTNSQQQEVLRQLQVVQAQLNQLISQNSSK